MMSFDRCAGGPATLVGRMPSSYGSIRERALLAEAGLVHEEHADVLLRMILLHLLDKKGALSLNRAIAAWLFFS